MTLVVNALIPAASTGCLAVPSLRRRNPPSSKMANEIGTEFFRTKKWPPGRWGKNPAYMTPTRQPFVISSLEEDSRAGKSCGYPTGNSPVANLKKLGICLGFCADVPLRPPIHHTPLCHLCAPHCPINQAAHEPRVPGPLGSSLLPN